MLGAEFGGSKVPKSLEENERGMKLLGEEIIPMGKISKPDSRGHGEGIEENEVPDDNRMVTRNFFQVHRDMCTINSVVNVPTFSAEKTAFHCENRSDNILAYPLKLNYSLPTLRITEVEDEIEQYTPCLDHVDLQESNNVFIGYSMHHVDKVKQLKQHPFFVQPPSLSNPRPCSLLSEGTCLEEFMSNGKNAFEDVEMELDSIKRESVSDVKKKTVVDVANSKDICTLSAYEQPVSQVYQSDSSFKAIKNQQGAPVLDARLPGLSKQIEQMITLPKQKFMQVHRDMFTINSVVNVTTFSAEKTAFHCENRSDNILADPLKVSYSLPTLRITEVEDEIEQYTPCLDHADLQESNSVFIGYSMHHVDKVKQLKQHPFFVQPSSLSNPRPCSLLSEGTCLEEFMSNRENAFEDVEMELDSIKRESVSDVKKKTVVDVDKSKDICTFSAYEQPVSQVYQSDSSFKAIKNQQGAPVLDARLLGLSNQTEQMITSPKQIFMEGPNKISSKDKTKQISESNISNQVGSQNFCLNSPKDLLAQSCEKLSEQIDDNKRKGRTGANPIPIKNKAKRIGKCNISTQEKNGNPKDHSHPKEMPKFDLYTVEEEEGSGGYGTVYRARRKTDGVKFAIKYPHPDAHKCNIDNERKMLERFGGNDFIIRYEGSCKSENSDCFVLKHVDHDRADVLKKDIDVSELQWYGYCMFTALRSLHKQGVVHRDVKPGNFLFSRKTGIGYMIDFNLAKDLHAKEANAGGNSHHKTVSPNKRRRILDSKAPELPSVTLKMGLNRLKSQMLGKKALDANCRNSIASQGADGSVLTSAKDRTTTTTPSLERLREPLPYQGRKEIMNLAQEAMQISTQQVACAPSNKRKRVAAPSAVTGRKLVYPTPMPTHSFDNATPSSGFLKEEGKKLKEGSCSGTKGYRAPEVLLRSVHQGAKLDIWSAGVTLLYLMTGKMPFTGEPEQNMKDIVKLRGSEELWELAKLHDRISSFPKELYDVQYLPSMELRQWCKAYSKRPEFVKTIPNSLFDLVDKCLVVNPRLRISAEEALKHDFFAPCIKLVTARRRRIIIQKES